MRTLPSGVATKLAQGVSHFACCWEVTRKDGTVLRLTGHHSALTVDGDEYVPAGVIWPSTLRQASGTSVDNMSVSGVLSSDLISVLDVLSARYDHADVRFFLVDYTDPEPFAEVVGKFGEIQAGDNRFETELRLLSQRLTQKVVELTTRDCRCMDFADERCGLSAATYTFSSDVGSGVAPTRVAFQATGSGVTSKPDGYFANGKLTWTSGANVGIICDVKASETTTGLIELQIPLSYDVEIGDEFDLVAGCDRRFETCRDKFSNTINFQGEPHVRGTDYMVRTVIR